MNSQLRSRTPIGPTKECVLIERVDARIVLGRERHPGAQARRAHNLRRAAARRTNTSRVRRRIDQSPRAVARRALRAL